MAQVTRGALRAFCLALGLAAAIPAAAQTGSIEGRVTDPTGLHLPGVKVTATAEGTARPAPRSTTSGRDGTYQLARLAPAAYTVVFELAGFETQKRTVHVTVAGDRSVATLDIELPIASIPASITVTPEPHLHGIDPALPQGATFDASMLELLPMDTTLEARVTLAPGVSAAGPGGTITISGAPSFGNLFLLDGFVINENLRQQARPFLIPDALQETKVTPSSIAAEFGRFQGGVVNSVTKSGTNKFSVSFRAGFSNDHWRALTPFGGDRTLNHRQPALEATVGGPVVPNRVWYFGAVRLDRSEQNRVMPYSLVNYAYGDHMQRYEAKVNWAPSKRQSLRVSYYGVNATHTNVANGQVMDLASLYNDSVPESMTAGVYNIALGATTLAEIRYSNRQLTYADAGASSTTLAGAGTPIWDRSRSSARFNSPFGCAVCPGSDDERDNQNLVLKAMWSLPTRRGTHDLVAGADVFEESRRNNSYQSGSAFRVLSTRATIVGDKIYPVFLADRTTWIYWTPIAKDAVGNRLLTYSGFVADNWRLNARTTLRLGMRYDYNDDRDSQGQAVVHSQEFSPRAGITWDAGGTGRWVVNAAFARYAASINSNIADSASSGGRPSTLIYDYLGPTVNATTATVASADALKTLFDWFNANGGTARATRSAPSIPGLTTRINPALRPPNASEWALGLTHPFGAGAVRVDGVYRTTGDFYANKRDMTTGRVSDGLGHYYDLLVVTNSDKVERTYAALNTLFSYRLGRRGQANASYTLSWTRGNADGETSTTVGPDAAAFTDYPEYRDPKWHSPLGWLSIDQRHKFRAWATLDVPAPTALGRVTVGVVQRIDTGRPYSATGNINPTAYVTNPGYVTPPTSVPYYFSARGAYRLDTVSATDLTLNVNRTFGTKTKVQVFFRGQFMNVFNQAAVVNVSRTVLTRNDSTVYAAFNPFTDTPVAGTHYGYGSSFGKPTSPSDYQVPREFSFTVGFRY